MVALGQEPEEPPVELLVHPEVAGAARLVREPARGDDRDAVVAGKRPQHVAEDAADLVRALGRRDRWDGAVHPDRHQTEPRVGVQIVRGHRDPVVELHLAQVRELEPAPRALVDDEARQPWVARHAVLLHPEPLVEPVGGAHVRLTDADGVLGQVVDRPVQEVVVGEHHEHVGPRCLEPAAHLGRRLEGEPLVGLRGAREPTGETRGVGHRHGRHDPRHGYRPSSAACRASARAVSSGNARL